MRLPPTATAPRLSIFPLYELPSINSLNANGLEPGATVAVVAGVAEAADEVMMVANNDDPDSAKKALKTIIAFGIAFLSLGIKAPPL